MYITQYTDYALRVLIYLAMQPQRRVTIAEIAEHYAISRTHLMKVVNQLVQEGLVQGLRGKGGGLALAQTPEQIRVGSVVRRIEQNFELVECFGAGNTCHIAPACKLKHVLNQALKAFLQKLDEYTLADLVANRRELQHFIPLINVQKKAPANRGGDETV